MASKTINILLVDDNQKFLDSLSERAALKGFKTFKAASGPEAIAIAQKHRIHVAVVDHKMPEMEGLEVITRLKTIAPEIQTILLTGHGDEKLKEATEALNTAYFGKEEMGKFWEFLSNLPFGNVNILLVDDEQKFLETLAERIKIRGYEPFTAINGRQALEIAKSTKIHIAVVDHKMPDMDGLIVITKLKEMDPNINTILLTGHGSEKLKEATEALNSAYFGKEEIGKFWGFVKKVLQRLETEMAAVGMATGGDIDDALEIESRGARKRTPPK